MLTFYKVTGKYSITDYFAKFIALNAASFQTYVRFN